MPFYAQKNQAPVPVGEEDWRYLEKAKNSFYSGDYGDCIEYAEQAREKRLQRCQWEIYTLEKTLRLSSVRRADGNFEDLLQVLDKNQLDSAATIVRIHLGIRGAEFYGNTLGGIISYENHLMEYPEADYLIGKVYRMEGEYNLAVQYMLSAYKSTDILNVPLEKYDIMYDIAELYKDCGDNENYEKFLLAILTDNKDYTNTTLMNALQRIIKEDTASSVENSSILFFSATKSSP